MPQYSVVSQDRFFNTVSVELFASEVKTYTCPAVSYGFTSESRLQQKAAKTQGETLIFPLYAHASSLVLSLQRIR